MDERLEQDLYEIEDELSALAERAKHVIEDFVSEQPHAALAIAAATGFVVGGGLTPRRIMRIGLAFLGPTITRTVYREATSALRGMFEGVPVEEHSPVIPS